MKTKTVLSQFQKLQSDTNLLTDRILSLDVDLIYANSGASKWSIVQILEHLRIAEKQTLQVITNNIEKNDNFQKVFILSDIVLFAVKTLFALKIKFKAPPYISNIAPKPDLNHTLTDWKSTRVKMLKLIESYPESLTNKIIFKHPILGNMALNHVIGFETAHFNLHKQQILEQLHPKII